jgi:hypothetical protein
LTKPAVIGESAEVIRLFIELKIARTVPSKPEYKFGVRNLSMMIRRPIPIRFVSILICFVKVGLNIA